LNCFDAVTALSNGNYLVGSPYWDDGAVEDAGAATWCDGTTGRVGVVSAANSLVGDTTGDRIGFLVTPLSNGNYVVRSPSWHNGAGAATWGSGTTDISGAVSAANSLVGSTAGDEVGYSVTVLSNGNYVVPSPDWDNDLVTDAGAVTWGSGTTGVKGMVSAANSLVGSTAGDRIGEGPLGVTTLKNGNYVVRSPTWDTSTVADVGAVTWGSGTTGIAGVVSAANSLVGSTAGDQVGCGSEFCDVEGVTALSNGNYVVVSIYWDNGAAADAGAVTWGEGSTGVMGVVSAVNSLVGTSADDRVGCAEADFCYGLVALNNGNYVVKSPWWDNGAAADAGAVTWGSGTAGVRGAISAANSLVGSFADDRVGCGNVYCAAGVTTLSNGNYVVRSLDWNNGTGAVTWGGGTSGVSGVVSAANSLVGHGGCGYVGEWVTPLTNGNYVVRSPECDIGGAWDAGAVTWGNGTTGTSGAIFEDNSLVGSTDGDGVGAGVTALTNGNYVVRSPHWHNGAVEDAGAVTWGNGSNGTVGAVSAANSLVGSTTDDGVGRYIVALSNGNYLVVNPYWDNGAAWDAGAVTWGNGTTGTSGAISEANSLVGSTVGDRLGCQDDYCTWPYVMALSSGSYVLSSPLWDNGVIVDAGAVTWGDRTGGTVGPIMAENSVRGTAASGGPSIVWAYDAVNRQLVVGRPADNIVTLFRLPPAYPVFLPVMLKNAP
jgi:hypothetical protein